MLLGLGQGILGFFTFRLLLPRRLCQITHGLGFWVINIAVLYSLWMLVFPLTPRAPLIVGSSGQINLTRQLADPFPLLFVLIVVAYGLFANVIWRLIFEIHHVLAHPHEIQRITPSESTEQGESL